MSLSLAMWRYMRALEFDVAGHAGILDSAPPFQLHFHTVFCYARDVKYSTRLSPSV